MEKWTRMRRKTQMKIKIETNRLTALVTGERKKARRKNETHAKK